MIRANTRFALTQILHLILSNYENCIYKTLAPSERHMKHRNTVPLRWSLIVAE
ncbi:MAG: hypothetical protein JETT_1174 [Candidatus Jettenia ecosi]|uniref:Uncharacterized protein n=1 Tax=Candidatus Jettenia ecosi TaxID=2494326 RepID=A0A533QCQ6_9BACT|nr:MAG: hypothetical protein JETT_1174 [Candidatus Jettenia ecosi]